MERLKLLMIFGTRPEAIKMCPLALELKRHGAFETRVLLTGQHRELADSVMSAFGVSADYDLALMRPGQTLTSLTTGILDGVGNILENEFRPDYALVHGDTTTAFASALSCFYHQVKTAHVEAGLRTRDIWAPFPEEANRAMISRIASLHFAPTKGNERNLRDDHITEGVYVTGNTGLDAFRYTIKEDYVFADPALRELDFKNYRTIVLTAHRRENIGAGIENICRAVKRAAEMRPDIQFVYPMHPNPAVRSTVLPILGGIDRVRLIEPLDVFDMHNLMARSYLCLTDSGGLQEEAPALGLPVIVLRGETERPEAVEAGTVVLAGTDEEKILAETLSLLDDEARYRRMRRAVNPYGDGHASERIAGVFETIMNR